MSMNIRSIIISCYYNIAISMYLRDKLLNDLCAYLSIYYND